MDDNLVAMTYCPDEKKPYTVLQYLPFEFLYFLLHFVCYGSFYNIRSPRRSGLIIIFHKLYYIDLKWVPPVFPLVLY